MKFNTLFLQTYLCSWWPKCSILISVISSVHTTCFQNASVLFRWPSVWPVCLQSHKNYSNAYRHITNLLISTWMFMFLNLCVCVDIHVHSIQQAISQSSHVYFNCFNKLYINTVQSSWSLLYYLMTTGESLTSLICSNISLLSVNLF